MPTGLVAFAAATAVVGGPRDYRADLDSRWTVAGRPNGGYLLAVLGRAALEATGQPHVVAASAHYLRPPTPGPVRIEVDVLRSGRTVSQVRATLRQDARDCVVALFTVGGLAAGPVSWSEGVPEVAVPPRDRCQPVGPVGPGGFDVSIMGQVDLRLDPACLGSARGRPSGHAELRGWLALLDGTDFDSVALLYAVDALPPATFEIAPSGWVPTLELTAYVRAQPSPGPVRVVQRAQLIDGGRVDEVCLVWDGTGRLVAQGTQLALIRPA